MPELPEVETVRNTLAHQLGHPTILSATVLWDNIIAYPDVASFCEQIENQTILGYERIGKYLIFVLQDYHLIIHLRMEGKFFYEPQGQVVMDKHTHVLFHLTQETTLRYHDVRKFGKMYLYPKSWELRKSVALQNIGFDAFDAQLDALYIQTYLSRHKRALKTILLDQGFVAGIGNIYADEICFHMGVAPTTIIVQPSLAFCEELKVTIQKVLAAAIEQGGTTIRSYTSSLGVHGRFQVYLMVHGRAKQACRVCGTIIEKEKVGGRGTYSCPHCQPK
ncbi:MAG: DNA-formamidopyrimidine glycosylase [Erysipelotrichaceae bacterium]